MAAVGSAALVVCLLTAVYAVGASLAGRASRPALVVSARRAVYSMVGLLALAFALLEAAYLRTDLRFALLFLGAAASSAFKPGGHGAPGC